MKKILFFGFIAFFAISCTNSNAEKSESAEKDATADKTPKRIEFSKMKAEDLNKKFDIDFEGKTFYSGYYEAYMDGDKEVLQGSFEVKGAEDQETYMNRLKKEDKKNEELEPIALLGNWSQNTYKGQFKEGKKDGKWTSDEHYYEAAGNATIVFDAATDGCTEGSYDGGAESICFKYEGKLTTCTFVGLAKLIKEIECQ
jgi:hypothetical protein